MKSAYELAMERLSKSSPTLKLTAAQKAEIAEIESKCKAKIAEREIAIRDEITGAIDKDNLELKQKLQEQLTFERKKLLADLEEKKELVRKGKQS